MLRPLNQSKQYDHLFTDIDSGRIKIPKFQREFVWRKEQTAKLIDSILKGFPVGTFIFWKTREALRFVKEIGNVSLPELPIGDSVHYVLDGQQRITSLYAVKKGLLISNDGDTIDYKDIFIDLSHATNTEEQVVVTELNEDLPMISVHRLLNGRMREFTREFGDELLDKIDEYKRLLGAEHSILLALVKKTNAFISLLIPL